MGPRAARIAAHRVPLRSAAGRAPGPEPGHLNTHPLHTAGQQDHPISCAAPPECFGRCGFCTCRVVYSPPMAEQPSHNPAIEGVLVVDKPLGMSSMQVCAKVRGKLRAGGAPKRVKVGHGGTLDPLATGVLVVLVGKATKRCDQVMAGTKRYETTIDLSRLSSTDDLEGEMTPVEIERVPTPEDVRRACAIWTGTVMQIPPKYSAVKVQGQRAYAMARRGETIELKPRPVRIDAIEIVSFDWPMLTLDITCGKGTYIRSLGRDIGNAVGAGGVLTALRRTRVGSFTIDEAVALDELPDPMDPATLCLDPSRFDAG